MYLRTLGGLELRGGFHRPKLLLLLAYLALEGPKDRRHLSELFWHSAAEPLTSLRMALSQLRQGAPEAFFTTGKQVGAKLEMDALTLLRHLEEGRLEEAIMLYQGAFLTGFFLRDWSVELEDWVYSTREFLAERVRMALTELAERDAAVGDFRAAARRAEEAWQLAGAPEPEPEGIERIYRLLVAGGSLRATELQKEAQSYGLSLHLDQHEARTRFATALDSGVRSIPNNLPTPATSFVGRDPELLGLAELLAEPNTRLITLAGPGGVGKSRLAVQAACGELQGKRFAEGIYFVALDALAEADLIPLAVAESLGIELSGKDEPLAELVRVLRDKALLFILDNFEQLMAGVGVISALLEGCPRLKLLVTSRERLNLMSEQLFVLEGLPLPEGSLSLEDARYHDAVQLFLQRAKRARLDFTLLPENLPHVLTVCRLLAGIPLAIELAASWVRMMPVAEIAAEIGKNLDFLAAGTRDVRIRHQSLRATFEHSWDLLNPREQEALRKLSVFVGGFTREAASAVAGTTIPLLASLVDKSLMRMLEGSRYDRHPLLYQYTWEKLVAHPEEHADARAKQLAYFLGLAEAAEAKHQGAEQREWLARLEQEQSNLRAALDWALSGSAPEMGLRLAAALYHFWYYHSHLREGERWLQQALEVAADNEAWLGLRSRLLSAAGALANERGEDERAVKLFEERLALAQAQRDLLGQAAALNSLGVVAWGQQDYERARSFMEESTRLRRELGQPQLVSVTLNNLGLVALAQGRLDEARTLFEDSLAMSRELEDEMGVAMVLANLGAVALEMRDSNDAARCLKEALPLYQAVGDRTALAQCLEGFAAVASLRNEPEAAARLAGAAEAQRESLGALLRSAEQTWLERYLAPARATLSETRFAAAWEQGRVMSLDEALHDALSFAGDTSGETSNR